MTDCETCSALRIGNSLCETIEALRLHLSLIIGLCDGDGFNTVEGLKSVLDDIKKIAKGEMELKQIPMTTANNCLPCSLQATPDQMRTLLVGIVRLCAPYVDCDECPDRRMGECAEGDVYCTEHAILLMIDSLRRKSCE
jgi:hypothetical protein